MSGPGTLYGPAVCCKAEVMDLEILVSRICIRPVVRSVLLLGHHGYPRASDLILDKALEGR
jgi:hypothetical protein